MPRLIINRELTNDLRYDDDTPLIAQHTEGMGADTYHTIAMQLIIQCEVIENWVTSTKINKSQYFSARKSYLNDK